MSETKKIQPQDPAAITPETAAEDKTAGRKTSSYKFGYRKVASARWSGRKTNGAHYGG